MGFFVADQRSGTLKLKGAGEVVKETIVPLLFCVSKRNKENKWERERVSNQKLLNGCHQGQNDAVLELKSFLFSQPG